MKIETKKENLMSKPVIITADSACDLLPHTREEFGIHTLPIHINLGDRQGLDCVDIFPTDIYSSIRANGAMPKTASPSIEEFRGFFAQFTEQGCAVVHISVNSGFSSMCSTARLAAGETDGEVYVFDSRHFGVGEGMLCIQAAKLRDEGLSAEEIMGRMPALLARLKSMCVLDNLAYASKSGRCPPYVARMATILNIHPSANISNETGEFLLGKKYRGKMDAASEAWLRDSAAKFASVCDPALCYFAFTPDVPQARRDYMTELLQSLLPQVERWIVDPIGCVVSSNVGENCYALIGMGK